MQFTQEQYELLPYIAIPLANDATLSMKTGKNTNQIREMVKPMIEHGLVLMELVATREMYKLTMIGHGVVGGMAGSVHGMKNVGNFQVNNSSLYRKSTDYFNNKDSFERAFAVANDDMDSTIPDIRVNDDTDFGGGDFSGAGAGSDYDTDSSSSDSNSNDD